MQLLHDSQCPLDNKDKSTSEPTTKQDIVDALRTLHADPHLEQNIQDTFNTAGPMLMICAQIMAIGTLMHHPKEFAGKCQQTTAGNTFKDDLSAKKIKYYILNTVLEKQCTVNKGLSLWDEGSDEDKETAWTSRSCPRSRRRFEVQDNKENVPSMRSTPSSSRRTSSPFDSATNTHPLSRCRETARQSPVKKRPSASTRNRPLW